MTKQDFLKLGGNEWNQHGKERVYISAEAFNEIAETSFSEKTNKFFFDCQTNALMRSYKGKKPTVEIQYQQQRPTGRTFNRG